MGCDYDAMKSYLCAAFTELCRLTFHSRLVTEGARSLFPRAANPLLTPSQNYEDSLVMSADGQTPDVTSVMKKVQSVLKAEEVLPVLEKNRDEALRIVENRRDNDVLLRKLSEQALIYAGVLVGESEDKLCLVAANYAMREKHPNITNEIEDGSVALVEWLKKTVHTIKTASVSQ